MADRNVSPFFPGEELLRASAPLTASFVELRPIEVPRLVEVTLGLTYTRGAAGGFAELRLDWSLDGADGSWFSEVAVDPAVAVTQPDGAIAFYRGVLTLPQPADGEPLALLSPRIVRPAGRRFLRVSVREGSGLAVGSLAVSASFEIVQR